MRLTKRAVEGLAPERDGDRLAWDDALPGFGVRVKASGVRSYIVQYRIGGRSRRLTLGQHGRITLEQARRLAREAFGRVAAGRDPAEERRQAALEAQRVREEEAAERRRTVEAVVNGWLAHMEARAAKGKVRERTVAEYRRQAEREVLPRLGGRRLDTLSAADLRALHDALAERPVLANRVVSLVSQAWRWAAREGLADGANPTHGIEAYPEKPRDVHLTREELGRLGAALRDLEAEGRLDPRVGALVRLVALTGCRPGEVRRLAWDAVDLERRALRVRGGKTGDRTVWLSGPALAVLRRLEPVAGSPWVFPSPRHPSRPLGEHRKPWEVALARAKLSHVPPYVLRHTYASESEAAGNSLLVTAALLGHAQGRLGGMTGGYVHHVPADVRAASEKVGRRIAQALDGKGGAVVQDLPARGRRAR